MKKRILRTVLSLLLILSTIPTAFAADASAMTDISGHWAEESIGWAMEQNLFTGVSETQFVPDGSMTRGMFVTVLGRFAQIDQELYRDWYLSTLYTDVPKTTYYAPYINWATRMGITNGIGDGTFQPDAPVTREQMATFMVRFANIYHYDFTGSAETIVDGFSDIDKVAEYAVPAVESMRLTGILRGIDNNDGTYSFNPRANATRAECATVYQRLTDVLQRNTEFTPVEASGITVSETELTLVPGDKIKLTARVSPANVTNSTVTWVSTNPSVVSIDCNGNVRAKGNGVAELYAFTSNGLSAKCTVTSGSYVGYEYESYSSKCIHLFGKVVNSPRTVYATKQEADAHMTTVKIKVWDFADRSHTIKTTNTISVTVQENLAATIVQIFKEIYECDAHYPINDVQGYTYKANSEHASGLALDINPVENYYCTPDGEALVGSYFKPGVDPYSIAVEGEIDAIFNKYGFTRGIYWNSGYRDYMHYSFFGT